MQRQYSLVILLLTLFQLISCSVKEQLDEMHDSTVAMEQSTGEMGDTTNELNQATQNMLTLLRSKDSEDTRRGAFTQLGEAQSLVRKFELASVYYQSFEFQLWTLTQTDRAASRDYFYKIAMEEFFTSITEYIDDYSFDRKKIDPTTKDNQEWNLYAFAISMHYVHENQYRSKRENSNFEIVSFYDLLAKGLKKSAAYDRGEIGELKEYEQLILRNKDIALYLLQLRYNMFTTMALARLAKIDQASYWSNVGRYLTRWKLDLKKVNRANQEEAIEYLNYAQTTRNLLKSVGDKPVLNKKIKRILKNMRIKKISHTTESTNYLIDNRTELNHLVKALTN